MGVTSTLARFCARFLVLLLVAHTWEVYERTTMRSSFFFSLFVSFQHFHAFSTPACFCTDSACRLRQRPIMLSVSRPQSKPDAPKGGEGTDLFLVSILHSLANFSFFCPLRQQSGFCTVEFANWLVELELELVEFEFDQPDKSDKMPKK